MQSHFHLHQRGLKIISIASRAANNEFSVYVFTGELTDAPDPPKVKHSESKASSVCAESIKRPDAADETGLLNSTMAEIQQRRSN